MGLSPGERKTVSDGRLSTAGSLQRLAEGSYSNTLFHASSSYHEDLPRFCTLRGAGQGGLRLLSPADQDGVKRLGRWIIWRLCCPNAPECPRAECPLQKVYTTPIYRFSNQRLTGVHMQYMGIPIPGMCCGGTHPEINEIALPLVHRNWRLWFPPWQALPGVSRWRVRHQATALNTAA